MDFESFWCFPSANVKYFSKWGNLCVLSRITVAICVSIAGVGDKEILLSGATGFLAISGIQFIDLIFIVIGMTTPVVFFI